MIIKNKTEFIRQIRSWQIDTDWVVIKPNWVDNKPGNFTEPEILDWLFEALPQRKKVVESYTRWRGKRFAGPGELKGDLIGGKQHWDFYRQQDQEFLQKTGLQAVLDKHQVEYVNITDEVWRGDVVPTEKVRAMVEARYRPLVWQEFYSYVPAGLLDLCRKATFISLAKIKTEPAIADIGVSLSLKNVFGLIPHPSR